MNRFFIEYMNKNKNFKIDIIYFDNYENAKIWGKNNLDNFNLDLIKYKK
jgi:hypothetical protein